MGVGGSRVVTLSKSVAQVIQSLIFILFRMSSHTPLSSCSRLSRALNTTRRSSSSSSESSAPARKREPRFVSSSSSSEESESSEEELSLSLSLPLPESEELSSELSSSLFSVSSSSSESLPPRAKKRLDCGFSGGGGRTRRYRRKSWTP